MATRDIVVTVDEYEWLVLEDAAECAGMSVQAYASWVVRLAAMQSRSDIARRRATLASKSAPRAIDTAEQSESVAWAETFSERLSHRVERFRED